MNSPLDEDGFHSIAWDDAPASKPSSTRGDSHSPLSAIDDGSEGFETISNQSPIPENQNPSSPSAPNASASGSGGGIGMGAGMGTGMGMGNSSKRDDIGASPDKGKGVDVGRGSIEAARADAEVHLEDWGGRWMTILVHDPVKEHEGSKEQHISYGVKTTTNLNAFPQKGTEVRRRFQDFVFLREHLVKHFPACVVPPIPDKHRLEYIKGDRFSPDFVEKRRHDLQTFADRIARHPTLQRSQLVKDFLQSMEWAVAKHHHISHPPPDSNTSLLDSVSDSIINAFSRVRKPDARFVDMTDQIERFEEGFGSVERLVGRSRTRVNDLAQDYEDMAAAYQGLGYLESGITEPLNRFAEKMLDFSALLKYTNSTTVDPFLSQTHSLLAYAQAHRGVIKLRDQKQLDFEELSAYLSAISAERDRLAALSSGHAGAPVGLSTYLRDQVDKLRGTDDIHTRRERMRKLDGKIKELEEAVTAAHETSTAFSDEVVKEHSIYELSKKEEMKELLQGYADGQVEFFQRAMDDWDRIIPLLQRIRVDV